MSGIGAQAPAALAPRAVRRPRLGFLGVGWIGASRMHALVATDLAEVVAVAEPDPASRSEAVARVPGARGVGDLDELLAMDLDGVVIATPSAMHAEQARQALGQGVAVFCQKPLGRDQAETRSVIDAAHTADRLLGVDLSYRHLAAVQGVRTLLQYGELGRVYAAELCFHNAYGPDKPWFTQRSLSGGGCLIDLGTHLLDLVLWLTHASSAEVRSRVLLRGGEPVVTGSEAVEDFALAHLQLDSGIDARLACSWYLPAGRECVIEMTLYGTAGAASMRNVDGSFYDFRAEHWRGTNSEVIAQPPDDWGARALIQWTAQLAQTPRFDPAAEEYASVAGVLDAIYQPAA